MENGKNKTATAIALFLALSIAFTLAVFPLSYAWDTYTVPSFVYVGVSRYIIGVGQELNLYVWHDSLPINLADTWKLSVEVTAPDNSTEVLGPYDSDTTGSIFIPYAPTQTGVYKVVGMFHEFQYNKTTPPSFPFDTKPMGLYTFEAATSLPEYFTVQTDPIPWYPESPLPTEYWTRPIDQMNREWWPVAGNWLAGAAQKNWSSTNFAYGSAPESAHILWTREYWLGGITDARFGEPVDGYYGGETYEAYGLFPPIILQGRLYYNQYTPPREGWYCVDLHTGETVYWHNTTGAATAIGMIASYPTGIYGEALSFGQILNFASPNQYGSFGYLWSHNGQTGMHGAIGTPTSTWTMLDPGTGQYICSIANVSYSGTMVYDNSGNICYFNIANLGNTTNPNRYLQVWNTTHAILYGQQMLPGEWEVGGGFWRPMTNYTFNGEKGFSLNASIPDVQGSIRTIVADKYVIGGTSDHLWALDLTSGHEGRLLWNVSFTTPASIKNVAWSGPYVVPEYDVFYFTHAKGLKVSAYDLKTGSQLWESSEPESQWNSYGLNTNLYDGKLLTYGYGGEMRAYDIKTGEILWTYISKSTNFEGWYGNAPISSTVLADGKIYITSKEHSPDIPYRRDAMIRCVNATDGTEMWNMTAYCAQPVAISDGILVALNLMDNQIYAIGKGATDTSVSASPKVSVHGSNVLVEGSVIDISVGTQQLEQAMRFPNGVPAVSDESQSAWMEYVYKNAILPDATGVEVVLDVLDANGNYRNIGTVTSDANGFYSFAWEPDIPGKYTVYASFAGSRSYYGSCAETAFVVDEAPQATPPPTPEPAPMTDTYVMGFGIAMIVAIAVVGALILLLLRKR
jgi:hypothetical protein